MVEQADPKSPSQREERNAVHPNGPQGSLLGRVGASTSALLREAVSRPRPENLTANLASSSVRSTKGESSSGPSSQHLQEQCASHSYAPTTRYEDSFRSQHQQLPDLSESPNDEFNTFITTSNNFPEGPLVYNNLLDASTPHKGKEKISEDGDGAAVVRLLSDPDFSIEELPDTVSWPIREQTNIWDIDEQTEEVLARLKADMPPAPVHRIQSPNNPLNLLPNFNNQSRVPDKESPGAPGKAQTSGYTSQTTSPGKQTDLEPWLGVLASYQDEVWGGLLPLVKEAREEVRTAMEEGNTALKDCPAVRRLGMILGHIQPPKSP
ncbi:hypothetical protein MMC30_003477 [Trapelia coarctata]|nr:hypothetical protein [Trapelia coarctata]